MFYASFFIFYFVSVSLFRQCAVPLYLYFFFCACGSILQMFYASSFIFYFSLVHVAWFCPCSMPLHLYFSFLLCLWLGFANVICLFIDIFSFYASVSWFCHCSMPLFLIFILSFVSVSWLCQCSMPLIMYLFLFFFVCVLVLPKFYSSLFKFVIIFCA